MNKLQLQGILSAPFELDTWRGALTEIFNIKHFHQQPQQILLPSNDKAETAYELGSFATEDDRLIGLYQVNVLPGVMLERNKVGLRGLLRNVYKYDVDGALIVFVQDKKWRFSYVSEIRALDENGFATKSITNPRRFTYLFGPGESCLTAAERFQLLSENGQINLKDIQEAFSVEKISKQFFREYKEHYTKFVDYLVGSIFNITAFNNEEKAIRDFCKKLLGRIVFLYFLQKKGWLGVPVAGKWGDGDPAFLKNLFLETGANQSFYAAVLTTLFFDTLNTVRENDGCELIDGKPCRIPYLNGGLFEKETNKYDFLTFPPQLFTDLFAFFDSYNFTIYEDSPEEHTMAVDPEMLGHIFENLLEDNKDKGAYYTPKEIVHYMTQESLIEYLFTCLNTEHVELAPDRKTIDLFVKGEQVGMTFDQQKDNISREDIEHFIKQKETTDYIVKNAARIDRLLDNVKICDPAIGSGAFPMGLLHEIFSAKQVLHTCTANAPQWEPAKVKENIIQNSIYGVDIEKGAVDIARLRFWLSLIVDEETPRPLPNLDYKIVVGNSLVPKFEDEVIEIDWDLKSSVGKADEYVQKIQSLLKQIVSKQRKYFNPGGDKQKQKQEIRDLKIELLLTQMTLNKYRYTERNKLYSGFTTPTAKDRQRDLEIKITLAGFDRNIDKLKTLQGNDRPFDHFDWKLDFPDVMNENVAKDVGFDIVIANPPYVQMQKDHGKLAEEFKDKGYTTYERMGDIYSLFYEKGFLLLQKSGVLTFITSSQWMRARYGKSLRKCILQYNPKKLLLLGPGIFDSAVVDTNILIAAREKYISKLFGKVVKSRNQISGLRETDLISMPYVSEETWSVISPAKLNLNKKIREFGKPLSEWDIKINFGIKTGLNKAFIIDEKKRKELIALDLKSEKVIFPIFRGREIEKYHSKNNNKHLIYIPWHFPLNHDSNIKGYSLKAEKQFKKEYFAIYNYLLSFKTNLSNRNKTETGIRYEWYALQRFGAKYWKEFSKKKVVWKRIGSNLRFCYDESNAFSLDSTCIATGEKIKYLTGLLNSKLCNYQLFESAPRTGMGDLLISVQALEPLPVFYPSDKEEKLIVDLVDKIFGRKKQGEETTELESKIDLLVYKLYQLTYNEVLVVDPAFPLSKEAYENYKMG
jgi:adenine-specific DNA-methyltransferase